MARPTIVAAVLAVALAFLVVHSPPAAAQADDGAPRETTTVKFYGHVFDHTASSPMPANVEYPIGEANYGRGTIHECTRAGEVIGLSDDPVAANADRDCEDSYVNSLVLFSTAGFVDVSNRDEFLNHGGYSQLHNERGQVKPVLLDTAGDVTATIHMTVDVHGWADEGGETACVPPHPEGTPCAYPYWAWDPGVQPDWQVKATLYHAQLGEYQGEAGRQPPIEDTLRNGDPTVIAEGQTEPQVVTNGIPGAPKVLEIEIDLGSPQVEQIPRSDDFFLVYKFYSNSSGEKWSYHSWRIWAGEFYPPKFTMPVQNAFAVESTIPRFVHDKLVLLGVMSSPWGSYDIDPDATTLTVRNTDTGETVTPEAIQVFSDYSVAHGGHFDPANVTYIWDYDEDGLEPGTYEATITAQNFQGSVRTSCTGTFTVGPDGQPGETEAGTCGFQSLGEEERRELEEEAGEQAGEDGTELGAPDALPPTGGAALGALLAVAARPRT